MTRIKLGKPNFSRFHGAHAPGSYRVSQRVDSWGLCFICKGGNKFRLVLPEVYSLAIFRLASRSSSCQTNYICDTVWQFGRARDRGIVGIKRASRVRALNFCRADWNLRGRFVSRWTGSLLARSGFVLLEKDAYLKDHNTWYHVNSWGLKIIINTYWTF